MTTTKNAYVSVWLDDTAVEPEWVVDECDQFGNSNTVRCFDDEAEARDFADQYALKKGLPLR